MTTTKSTGPSERVRKQLEHEERHSATVAARRSRLGLSPATIERFLAETVEFDLHAKTILSLKMGTLGVLHAVSLCIHVIGRALAWSEAKDPKHAIKQVDRLLANENFVPWAMFDPWVKYLVAERDEILVALDWTEFDGDDQSTIALYLITRHGRATPLIWKTVQKSTLEKHRNGYEDEVIERLHEVLPKHVTVTLLADRGFGDQKRYEHLQMLGWDYAIRFRQAIHVTSAQGQTMTAAEWLLPNGRARMLKDVSVTADKTAIPAVVVVHAKGMKDPWCIATSRSDLTASQVVKLYGRRFRIEETFRDTKDIHFGMGLSATHIGSPARRDRLLFLAAFAFVLLTLLGEAGERAGLDRHLKANTSKKRTMSLYNQGCFWFMAIPNMKEERLERLIAAYAEILQEHRVTKEMLGVI